MRFEIETGVDELGGSNPVVRGILRFQDGTSCDSGWKDDLSHIRKDLFRRAAKAYAAYLERIGSTSRFEADMRPDGRPEVAAQFEAASGYDRLYRIKAIFGVDGLSYQIVYKHDAQEHLYSAYHETYNAACGRLAEHLADMVDRDRADKLAIHDAIVARAFRVYSEKIAQRKAEREAENDRRKQAAIEAEEERKAAYAANAAAKQELLKRSAVLRLGKRKNSKAIGIGIQFTVTCIKQARGSTWRVDHETSGMIVTSDPLTREDARLVVWALRQVGDWSGGTKSAIGAETFDAGREIAVCFRVGNFVRLLEIVEARQSQLQRKAVPA